MPPPATGGSIEANPETLPADGSTPVTITVTLLNARGQGTQGKTILLSQGSGHAVLTGSGVPDSNGVATFQATDLTAETVTFTAVDVTDGNLPVPGSAQVDFTAGNGGTNSPNPGQYTLLDSSIPGGGGIAILRPEANGKQAVVAVYNSSTGSLDDLDLSQFAVGGANSQVKLVHADANGQAAFSYTEAFTGTDQILATATITSTTSATPTTLLSNAASATWAAGKHVTFASLNPSPTTGEAGMPVTLQASLTDISVQPPAPIAGAAVTIGLGSQSCRATTDSAGNADRDGRRGGDLRRHHRQRGECRLHPHARPAPRQLPADGLLRGRRRARRRHRQRRPRSPSPACGAARGPQGMVHALHK